MDKGRGWQVGKSVLECNKNMLNNGLASDVKILVTSSASTVEIAAHKYMLVSRSPVFEAMLCGDFKEMSSTVSINDIEPDSFMEMLRFLYYGEAEITMDNVLPVLFAAKKYMLEGLVDICVTFLRTHINIHNVCMILNHCVMYEEKKLIYKCLKFMGPRVSDIFGTEGFLNLSQTALKYVLAYDRLIIDNELQVVAACKEWAEHTLTYSSSTSDETIRTALGDCLYQIRFATMTVTELAEAAGSSTILTDAETKVLFCHASTWNFEQTLSRLGFNIKPRTITYGYCRRFWQVNSGWNYTRELPDAISFQVDRPIWLMGISLYGSEKKEETHSYNISLYDGNLDKWFKQQSGVLETDGTDSPTSILFSHPPRRLEPGSVHTIKVLIHGPSTTYFGEGGLRTMRSQGVKFTFMSSSESTNESIVAGGQIPELIFRRI